MEKTLLVKESAELCDLVRPFLETQGTDLYCSYFERLPASLTYSPILGFFN